MNGRNFANNLSQWLRSRQYRALEEAYAGAQKIAELEAQCFDGGKISYTPNQSKTVYDYARSLRDRQLLRVRFNLVQFDVAILRSTANRTFLNLTDPVKVFLFILTTDMFVGFHSAEGWEVNFGVPPNQALVNSFIATVPVIIDSWLKFWIFNYLTRYSPPASAIYERMNT